MPGSDVYDTIKSDVSIETATQINQGTTGLSDAPGLDQVTVGGQRPISTTPTSTIDENAASTGSIWKEEFPSDRPKYYMNFHIYDYNRMNFVSLGNLNLVGVVRMPISLELRDNHTVDWGEDYVGFGVGMAAGALKELGSDIINKKPMSEGQLSDRAGQFVTGSGFAALDATAAIGGKAGLSGVGVAVKALAGFSPNKFITILFKGPTYKRHQFHWKLTPKDEIESEKIRRIVQTFNNTAAPGHYLEGAVFKFPRIVIPSFVPNPKYLYKFKPSVITQLHFNYAPGGQPAFYHKKASLETEAPESVTLSMTVIELEYWMTGDFNNTNNPGDVYDGTTGMARNLETGEAGTMTQATRSAIRKTPDNI